MVCPGSKVFENFFHRNMFFVLMLSQQPKPQLFLNNFDVASLSSPKIQESILLARILSESCHLDKSTALLHNHDSLNFPTFALVFDVSPLSNSPAQQAQVGFLPSVPESKKTHTSRGRVELNLICIMIHVLSF